MTLGGRMNREGTGWGKGSPYVLCSYPNIDIGRSRVMYNRKKFEGRFE